MSEEQTYYQKNKARQLALAKDYRQKHLDYYKTYWQTYYQENKSTLQQKQRERRWKRSTKKEQKTFLKTQKAVAPLVLDTVQEVTTIPMTIDRGNYTISWD